MDTTKLPYLIGRYINQTISGAERMELLALLEAEDHTTLADAGVEVWLREPLPLPGVSYDVEIERQVAAILAVDKTNRQVKNSSVISMGNERQIRKLRRLRWVAAVVLLISVGVYFLLSRSSVPAPALVQVVPADIPPAREGALLTLADGRQLLLDTIKNGVVALQGGTVATIINGALVYGNTGTEMLYNTMGTPKGRQFKITLPDGSSAWLNAASSIRYPTAFTGRERRVKITGEVYLEVVANARQPFVVETPLGAVQVLGTAFNINTYADEPVERTTLISGAIQVQNQLLQPGQQAVIKGKQLQIQQADITAVVAWKNGLFNLENVSLEELTRQIGRWYDIEVDFPDGIPHVIFEGKMSRNVQLKDVLKVLSSAGVNYILTNRKLTIKNTG